MTRTFSEVALCHLPDVEIGRVCITDRGYVYKNTVGFMIWSKADVSYAPVLASILATKTTDYVLFDVDVEPDPDLEVYDDA